MVEKFGLDVVLAMYLVYALGIGVVAFLICKIWILAFEKALIIFKIKREFYGYLDDKYRKKVYTPRIKEDGE